jgi:formylglycine-generating enzyme required for sulfatase activity
MNAIRTSKWRLLAGVLALSAGIEQAAAQPPPSVGISTSGGVKISVTGTNGGVYVIQSAVALAQSNAWGSMGFLQISPSNNEFLDASAAVTEKFYRALSQAPPSNMVFIPPNTFTLGSPTNELERSSDEGPQTTVALSRGFWMGRFLVTQGDYQSLIGANPSDFAGDSNRPVERVTWLDATNYCALLTQQELAAGRIPPGSHFRLPTEAEWECAARAGTTTRFYYGDDPGATNLSSHAWFGAMNGITTHPVGQKLPNAWGLYDMAGDVWEWCQDWYGPYPGGTETDPQGPASNPQGVKVIRGGGWDAFESDCRSARRSSEPVSPFIRDDTIGFRVVLAIDQ